ncbi:DNA cytosine methyltransferase [Cystobacter fuscus]|nr:DNA cytosine methyltransferase [Cystobacter fuscus]
MLDLFSGCGGLTLGFVSAGCTSVGGVEIDRDAARSYAWNFHPVHGQPDEYHAYPKSVVDHGPRELLHDLEARSSKKGIDLIVGGPPCPAFTRVGRAKLREVYNHPEAFKHDERATLYIEYLKYVRELKPVALVMENVPDILNWGGHNVGDEICKSLDELGYRCAYTLLNAANYGVPQMRERFFLVAIHKQAGIEPAFPTPTRRYEFPLGYLSSRKVALKKVHSPGNAAAHLWYRPPPQSRLDAPPPVSAEQALADLPELKGHLNGMDRRGRRSLDGNLPYGDEPRNDYAQLMRTWPGYMGVGYLRDHVTRCLTMRDYRLFERMRADQDYPKAYELAEQLFTDALAQHEQRTGEVLRPNSSEYKKLRAEYVPPYDHKKFPNKWRKMAADAPARTLMAHLGKDTYSHIHYDSNQARVISVREAARLQSFPDGFRFSGAMNTAFRQIGNSVPPLLSWAIADQLLLQLEAKSRKPSPEHKLESPTTRRAAVKVA